MSNLPTTAEPQEVQGKALTTEQSVDFKLKAWRDLAAELKAFISNGVPTIAGIGDKVGYQKVSEWRKKAMRARTGLDSHRKELTAEARKYQDFVNSKAKEITAEIEAVEDALFAEEDRIDKLIEADKAAKQKVIDDRVNARTQALLAVNGIASVRLEQLAAMPEEHFQTVLKAATAVFEDEKRKREAAEAELARLQAEEASRKAEEERKRREALEAEEARLKAMREEQERIAREQREAQAKIDAETARIKAEAERVEREAREAKIAAEAAERARIEAEEKAKREQAAREAKAEENRKAEEAKARAEAARLAAIEAAKPDTEKLKAFFPSFDSLPRPQVGTEAAEAILKTFEADLSSLIVRATIKAEGLIR